MGNNKNEIDIVFIIKTLWQKKIQLVVMTSISAVISIYVAINLPNIYISKSLLSPTSQAENLSSNIGSMSLMANNYLGLNIPSETMSSKNEAIETIKSYDFFTKFFLPNIKLENLLALKKWDYNNNILIYDEELFDKEKNTWIRETSNNKSLVPTNQEAYKVYSEILSINENAATGFVSLSIEHKSPIIAKNWVSIIIKNINESMREAAKRRASTSIEFLNDSESKTNIKPLKEAISILLENEIKTLMLASANEDYVFKIIDSPLIPEDKSKPNRALICIIGTIFGGLLSALITILQRFKDDILSIFY